jgi:aspartate carbamoyltransferase catalytic subunit
MNPTSRKHPAPDGAGVFFAPGPRHLLGLEGLPKEEIESLLADAASLRERTRRRELPTDELRHLTVCGAFFEDSTRTRTSFEIAARRMGALSVTFAAGGSSVSKGESLLDTMRVIQSMRVDVLVVRHPEEGAPHFLAKHLDACVVNAGDGTHEHPTQGLLDLLALSDAWQGRFVGREIAIVGDIAHSRVARSAIFGLTTLGAEVTVTGPATLMPADVESLGVRLAPSVEDAMHGADAVMALRIQRERMAAGLVPSPGEYARVWGIDAERVALMKPQAVVLHPGPVNRDVELASDVLDGPRSVVFDQVENGVAVRCAVLRRCAAALEPAR